MPTKKKEFYDELDKILERGRMLKIPKKEITDYIEKNYRAGTNNKN